MKASYRRAISAHLMRSERAAPYLLRLTALVLLALQTAQASQFTAEGSDTGSAVGSRYMALGGTGAAFADDAYAVYYNPAGLMDVDGFTVSGERQLNAELRPVSFLGTALRLPVPQSWGVRVAVGAAYFPRIHARANGAFAADDVESVFLRYLLPGLSSTFDGDINSKTKVYRLAAGFSPERQDHWSIGISVDHIDCQTDFCGVHATSDGYTVISAGAKATSLGISGRWRATSKLNLGVSVSDLGATLSLDTVTTDNAGTRENSYDVSFPIKVIAGASYQYSSRLMLATDLDWMTGDYGSESISVAILRAGSEYWYRPWLAFRAGLVAPVHLEFGETGTISLPFPVAPTLGIGWKQPHWRADLAIYANPLQSAHEDKPAAAANLTLSLDF